MSDNSELIFTYKNFECRLNSCYQNRIDISNNMNCYFFVYFTNLATIEIAELEKLLKQFILVHQDGIKTGTQQLRRQIRGLLEI